MPSTPQSPSLKPTTTLRKPKVKQQETATPGSGKPGSEGGIVFDKAAIKPKSETNMASKSANKVASLPQEKEVPATSSTPAGPNRQRRRPRKLNKEPPPGTDQPTPNNVTEVPPPVSTGELEALKSRVRGLEAKVEELYNSGALDRSGRSPRRRGSCSARCC